MRAVERAAIYHNGLGWIKCLHVGRTEEGAFGGGLEIDGAVDLVGHGSGIVIVVGDIFNVHWASNLRAFDDNLGERIFIQVVDRCLVGGSGRAG